MHQNLKIETHQNRTYLLCSLVAVEQVEVSEGETLSVPLLVLVKLLQLLSLYLFEFFLEFLWQLASQISLHGFVSFQNFYLLLHGLQVSLAILALTHHIQDPITVGSGE